MHFMRVLKVIIVWLSAGILLAGCGTNGPSTGSLSTAKPSPTPVVPSPVPTSTPAATEPPAPAAIELTILHTNDNWGATEPCG